MEALKEMHSVLRWAVLVFIVIAIVNALIKLKTGKFSSSDKLISVLALATTHVQVLMGLIMYVGYGYYKLVSQMGDADSRMKAVEHPLTMLLGVVFITIGYSKSKKKATDKAKFKTIALFYSIGLLFILSRIPW